MRGVTSKLTPFDDTHDRSDEHAYDGASNNERFELFARSLARLLVQHARCSRVISIRALVPLTRSEPFIP